MDQCSGLVDWADNMAATFVFLLWHGGVGIGMADVENRKMV